MRKTMKAAVIRAYGSNDVVGIEQVARPKPGAGQVLVRVAAAGVNPIDWKIRDGAGARMGMTLPIHLGSELVGTVEVVGEGVDGLEAGALVFGMVKAGAFADYALADAANLVRVPAGLDAAQAAALPLAGTTAWQALFSKARLVAGQRLLITNSAGGVGSLAVQFAKAIGAEVTALASPRNEDFVRRLGADRIIDYTRQPFEEAVHDIDVVFDTVGGDTFERAFVTLKPGGFMVTVVAFPKDEGERYGVTVERSATLPNGAYLSAIAGLVSQGEVVATVDTVLPFAKLKEALALSERGQASGKIVVRMDG